MEIKDLLGLALIGIAIPLSVALTCLSSRIREAAFFLLVTGIVITERLDINFLSREWYRGTTRGFEFSFVDILAMALLLSSVALPRPGRPRWYWPASLGPILLFFLYGCVSVAMSDPKLFGFFELSKMMRAAVIFLAASLFVRSERELRILVLALACTVAFEGIWSLKQRYLGGVYRATGTLNHANSLSMYLCMTAPVLVAVAASKLPSFFRYISYMGIACAAVGIVLTVSRAGIPIFFLMLAGATLACASMRITFKKIAAAVLVVIGLAVLTYASFGTIKARYAQASLEEEYGAGETEGRGVYLRLAKNISDEHFFGIGLNNWSYWISKTYGAKQGLVYDDYDQINYEQIQEEDPGYQHAPPAHNLGALTIGELGIPGLIVFSFIWFRWFQMGLTFLWRRSAEAVHRVGAGLFFASSGIFLQSITEWVYRQTSILFTLYLLMGVLASLYHLKSHREAC